MFDGIDQPGNGGIAQVDQGLDVAAPTPEEIGVFK